MTQSLILIVLALFAVAPVICSCILTLTYTLYLFVANEEHGVHHAQEYENRFWTIFALLFSTALFFAKDSPIAFGRYSPTLGFIGVLLSSYAMHLWDRYMHRVALSRQTQLRRTISLHKTHGHHAVVTMEELLLQINKCLMDIDQLLIPSTINNFINQRFVFKNEKRIIQIFTECDAVALNYLVCHVKLGLLIYKIKDHRNFTGQHRTEMVQLLAVDRLPALTAMSRVIVLHALQILKLRANPRAEHWVRNIILNTHGDDLSEIKTLTDAKGDYFSMNKLIYDDIKSETIRQDILAHIRREGAYQISHMQMGTKRAQRRQHMAWRKILSDVDDTLLSSGGSYPAGIDKRYGKKIVYPGVLAFYRELDLGTRGPEEWPENRVGNLVFLSARPHVYKDMSEKSSFRKFEKLRMPNVDGRKGMHTVPSMLAGDLISGTQYITTNDFEPLARKKFDNFKRYVSIYPEYEHIFVCDNGQGDVRAAELMFDSFPYEFQAVYVHVVQKITKTYGYDPRRWKEKEIYAFFFRTYPEAAFHAATREPPLIRITGLRRVCDEAVNDFLSISSKEWQSEKQKADRRAELNQAIWRANALLELNGVEPVMPILAERQWKDGEKVKTPYGSAVILGFDPAFNRYEVALDWRPLNAQVNEHLQKVKEEAIRPRNQTSERRASVPAQLATVLETDEASDHEADLDVDHTQLTLKRRNTSLLKSIKAHSTGSIQGSASEIASVSAESREVVSSSAEPFVPTSASSDSSSISSKSSDGSQTGKSTSSSRSRNLNVVATIDGRFISKFVPPHLPVVDKRPSALVSFFSGSPTNKVSKQPAFLGGEKCTTPYGPGTVSEHRIEEKIVVVDLFGWNARAYLNEECVKLAAKESLLSSLFRGRSSIAVTAVEPPKQLDFPFAHGTMIRTPFGEAEVTQPLAIKYKRDGSKVDPAASNVTIGLSIVAWTLADGSHPKLYCTVKTAQTWKDAKGGVKPTGDRDSILSAFGTLVSSTLDLFSTQKPKVEAEKLPIKFDRYYQDAASVSTAFGNGRIIGFRGSDGFYKISLSQWTMGNGSHPTAWIRGIDIKYAIAKDCKEGYPVLTKLGLTGTLESVQPTTGT